MKGISFCVTSFVWNTRLAFEVCDDVINSSVEKIQRIAVFCAPEKMHQIQVRQWCLSASFAFLSVLRWVLKIFFIYASFYRISSGDNFAVITQGRLICERGFVEQAYLHLFIIESPLLQFPVITNQMVRVNFRLKGWVEVGHTSVHITIHYNVCEISQDIMSRFCNLWQRRAEFLAATCSPPIL